MTPDERETCLDRLKVALLRFGTLMARMERRNPHAADGGGALSVLLAQAWIPGRVPDEELLAATEMIEGLALLPMRRLEQELPWFQQFWDVPVVRAIGETIEKWDG